MFGHCQTCNAVIFQGNNDDSIVSHNGLVVVHPMFSILSQYPNIFLNLTAMPLDICRSLGDKEDVQILLGDNLHNTQ